MPTRIQYLTINADMAIKIIIINIIQQLINVMSDPHQLRILKINLPILTKKKKEKTKLKINNT